MTSPVQRMASTGNARLMRRWKANCDCMEQKGDFPKLFASTVP